MTYLPKGIEASGGLQPWMDRPDIRVAHKGLGFDDFEYRVEQDYKKSRIAKDFGLRTPKPIDNWLVWYARHKEKKTHER